MESGTAYVTARTGAVAAAVCFFLPWVGCQGTSMSGAEVGGSLWLVFLASIGIAGSVVHHMRAGRLANSKASVTILALGGMALMLIGYLRLRSSDIGPFVEIRIGGLGSFLGLAAALFASRHFDDRGSGPSTVPAADGRDEPGSS